MSSSRLNNDVGNIDVSLSLCEVKIVNFNLFINLLHNHFAISWKRAP